MSIVNSFRQENSVIHLNDVIEEFKYVYRDTEVTAGDFVEFIEGVAYNVDYGTSTDTQLNGETYTGATISAVALDDKRVFVAHSRGSTYHLYGTVVTIDGINISSGEDVVLNSTNYSGAVISTELLPTGKIFIAHSYSATYCLYAMIITINDTTVVAGTDVAINTYQYAGQKISTGFLDDGRLYIAHSRIRGTSGTSLSLYTAVCTIQDTTITLNVDAEINSVGNGAICAVSLAGNYIFVARNAPDSSSDSYTMRCNLVEVSNNSATSIYEVYLLGINGTYTGQYMSMCKLTETKVFIAHSLGQGNNYLYGLVVNIIDEVVHPQTDTALCTSVTNVANKLLTLPINENLVLITHNYTTSTYQLYTTVAAIQENTITNGSGGSYALSTASYSGYCSVPVLLKNGSITILHSNTNSYFLNGVIAVLNDSNVPTLDISINKNEQQVMPTTQEYANAIALSSGEGGDTIEHKDQVKIARVYKVIEESEVTYTDDFLAAATWTANSTTEYISDNGIKLNINTTNSSNTGTIDDAFDGDTSETFWEVGYSSTNSIQITLPTPLAITSMKIKIGNNTLFQDTYYVEASEDNINWDELETSVFGGSGITTSINLGVQKYYQYYRVRTVQGNGISTIELYEWQILEYKKKETVVLE